MSMNFKSEDYTRSRTLCSFECLGESFRVVRRRIDGKLWRNYLMLLHDNVPMIDEYRDGDPSEAMASWRHKIETFFETPEALKKAIAEQRQRNGA